MRRATVRRLVLALVLGATTAAMAQERFGGVSGVVTDTSNAAVPGATITATNKQTGAVRVVVSGSDGAYSIPNLDPGRYSVTIELSGFQKVTAEDLVVLLGKNVDFPAQLKVGAITETVDVTARVEKQIDLKSTTIAHNVTAEEFDRMPKARSFQGIALTSPGVNAGDIEGGFQVNGASGSENTYTVDGVVTNSLIYGSSRQNTVFEYLQEVQVKTGGIDAEYGGALGGVISAVTKSGGNTFHGEGHYYYFGNGLNAGPVPRIQLSPVDNQTIFHLQDGKQKDNRNEFGASAGGPIVKDRLFFFASASPRLVRRTNDYLFSNGTEPGSLSNSQTVTQAFGKLTYSAGRVQANGSALITPSRSDGTLIAYRGTCAQCTVSTKAANTFLPAQGFAINQNNFSGNVDIWLGKSNFMTFRGGYFYDSYKDTGIPTITSYTYLRTSVGAPNIPANLQGPIGTYNVPPAEIANFDTTKRVFGDVVYNHLFSGAGSHVFKAGAGVQRVANNVNDAYPGGFVEVYWNTVYPSPFLGPVTGTYGYYRVNDLATRGNVHGRMVSLYAQDAWTVTPRLTLNVGLRTENERVPSFRPDITSAVFDFSFGDKIAPRLGASYDVRGDGKLKVYGSWGRYYDWVKYEIARGSFGGDVWHLFYRSLDTLDLASLNLNNMPGRDLWGSSTGFRDFRLTQFDAIDANLKPMSQDSTNAGVQYQLNPTTAIDIHYVHNQLRRTIEDYSALVNGDNVYQIGNPGEGKASIYPASYPNTADFPMPRAIRKYDALQLSVSRRFSRNWFGSGNYTYSRLYGNYAGLGDSDEILTPTTGTSAFTAQQQGGSIARPGTNTSSGWDTDTILWDSHGNLDVKGRLATDRPHVVKLYGAYQFGVGTQVGAFFYGGSGTPISTQVNAYPDNEGLFVEGRGDIECSSTCPPNGKPRGDKIWRTPVLTRTDLLVSHEFNLRRAQKVRLELQVINLFNQKTATHLFNFLNKGAPGQGFTIPADAIDVRNENLAKGYNYNALIRASPDGALAYDPRYGQADLWQTGAQGQFTVKFIF